jgi:uncharacterized protein (DUF3084 family)
MTSAYILIVAILLLGGVIATLGDRIGTKVGKARLSLFKLRPRKTATLVTIITGSLISASTLGILFASSKSLRDGVFELDNILKKLRIARAEIQVINARKNQVEQELAEARSEEADAQKRLDATNQNFQQAQTQLKKVSGQAATLRSEVKSLLAERQELIEQRNQLNEQITQLNEQITQLNGQVTQLKSQVTQLKAQVAERDQELVKRGRTIEERNQELAEQDEAIAQFDERIAERDRVIDQRSARLKELEQQLKESIVQREARLKELEKQLKEAITQRETRLQELEQQLTQQEIQVAERDKQLAEGEKQLAFLQRQVDTLEQYYENYRVLRQGNVALVRGQVLAFGVVRIVEPRAANQAIDQLLREANRTAVEITRGKSNSNEPLVQITQAQVDQLINQVKDGKDYVVRILSAGNYVQGEKSVQVFADAALNQVVFEAGDVLAAISADSSTMSNEEIRKRLDQLLAASQFRARRAGILGDIQVGDGRLLTLIRFIEQLDQSDQLLDVKAVAQEVTYTAGPLKMQLVAIKDGQVVFRT